jgi:pyridoxamine 5'-phosphate oxidase
VGARLSARSSPQSSVVAGRKVLESEMQRQKTEHGENPPRPTHWGGYRVMPARIEFWQGREDRLHDRLLYSRTRDAWKIERLAP